MREKLSPQINTEFKDSLEPHQYLSDRESVIQADVSLDEDKDVFIVVPYESTNPYRVYLLPTQQESQDPKTMMTSKLGVITSYWEEFSKALVAPDKLHKSDAIELCVVPVFENQDGDFHFVVKPHRPGFLGYEEAQYPSSLTSINYGGDGDFFSSCRVGKFNVRVNDAQQSKYTLAVEDLGISPELSHQVAEIWSDMRRQMGVFYAETVTDYLQSTADEELDQESFAWLQAQHLQSPIEATYQVARSAYRQNFDEVKMLSIADALIKHHKQVLLDQGKDSQPYQASQQLVQFLDQLHTTAKNSL